MTSPPPAFEAYGAPEAQAKTAMRGLGDAAGIAGHRSRHKDSQ
jgi:hypothetical protein